MIPASRVDSLNPKIPEISLSGFSVAVGPILGLHGCVFCVPEQFGAPPSIAFGFIQDSFATFSTSWSVGCSRHSLSPGFRAPHRQAVVLANLSPDLACQSPKLFRKVGNRSRRRFAIARRVFPVWSTKRKIFFNPCLVGSIQDRGFRELPFPFRAFRCKQMAPARLAAQDFPRASHFETLGYRLFGLTSSDRFWHKEPVKYASPSDSQGQNDRLVTTIVSRHIPGGNGCVDTTLPRRLTRLLWCGRFSVRPHGQILAQLRMPTAFPTKTTMIAPIIERIIPAG
jgi:hypothetical protein